MSRSTLTRFAEAVIFLLAAASLPGQEVTVVPIDLYVNGRAEGTINCRVADQSISVEKDQLIESLRGVLAAARLQGLRSAEAPTGYLDAADLARFGVEARYDPAALRLDLAIAARDQEPQVVTIGGGPPANLAVEGPADFSAYLNLRALTSLQAASVMGEAPSWSVPAQLIAQPVANYRGWVLDASVTGSHASAWGASLDYARVSHDFVENNQRLTVGSLFMPTAGFMAAQPSYGVEFFQDPRMTQSLRGFAPLPRQFVLPETSTVSVLVNTTAIGAYRLDAGRYVIPNIQFEDGLNSLTVRADQVLLQEVIPYDSRLLAQGGMSYSAGLGIPQWQLAPPVLSAFWRYGITPFVTAGIYTQDGLDAQVGGAEATYSTPVGNFHAQLGVSHAAALDLGAEMDYRLAFRYGMYYPVVGLSAQYTGSAFTAPGLSSSQNAYSWTLAASYSQPLPYQLGVGVGVSYQVGRDANPDLLSATVTVARPVAGDAALSVMTTVNRQGGGTPQVQVTVSLSSVRERARESLFASSALDRPAATVNLNYQPSPLLPRGTFSVSRDSDIQGANVGLQYTAPFVDSSISDALTPGINSLTLSVGAALVTAGGAFAVSRPISDSFAILLPRDNMLGQTVVVDRTADGYAGMVTSRFNVGVPDLVSYTRRTVSLSSPTAPADSDLGPSIRVLQPTYKSGTVLAVGTRAAILLSGKLFAGGAPVSYRSGKLSSASRSEVFFTDQDGSFQVYRLEPGAWNLTIDGMDAVKEIVVPESATRQYDLGTVALEESP